VEVATVFDYTGAALYWTSCLESGPTYIPDSRSLWEFLWDRREVVHGVAHSHPHGMNDPSDTDVTTWRAIEKGLGRKLFWPIVTTSSVKVFHHNPVTGNYEHTQMPLSYDVTSEIWGATIQQLRKRSYDPYLAGANDDRPCYDNG
jgi:proteasome lid subunit RPN8/RPN11